MHLADAFIQSDIQAIYLLLVCVPWELNPQHFALLTQCFTNEPQKLDIYIYKTFKTYSESIDASHTNSLLFNVGNVSGPTEHYKSFKETQ